MCLRAASLPSTSADFLIASISAFAAVRIFSASSSAPAALRRLSPFARPSRVPSEQPADEPEPDRDQNEDRFHQSTRRVGRDLGDDVMTSASCGSRGDSIDAADTRTRARCAAQPAPRRASRRSTRAPNRATARRDRTRGRDHEARRSPRARRRAHRPAARAAQRRSTSSSTRPRETRAGDLRHRSADTRRAVRGHARCYRRGPYRPRCPSPHRARSRCPPEPIARGGSRPSAISRLATSRTSGSAHRAPHAASAGWPACYGDHGPGLTGRTRAETKEARGIIAAGLRRSRSQAIESPGKIASATSSRARA